MSKPNKGKPVPRKKGTSKTQANLGSVGKLMGVDAPDPEEQDQGAPPLPTVTAAPSATAPKKEQTTPGQKQEPLVLDFITKPAQMKVRVDNEDYAFWEAVTNAAFYEVQVFKRETSGGKYVLHFEERVTELHFDLTKIPLEGLSPSTFLKTKVAAMTVKMKELAKDEVGVSYLLSPQPSVGQTPIATANAPAATAAAAATQPGATNTAPAAQTQAAQTQQTPAQSMETFVPGLTGTLATWIQLPNADHQKVTVRTGRRGCLDSRLNTLLGPVNCDVTEFDLGTANLASIALGNRLILLVEVFDGNNVKIGEGKLEAGQLIRLAHTAAATLAAAATAAATPPTTAASAASPPPASSVPPPPPLKWWEQRMTLIVGATALVIMMLYLILRPSGQQQGSSRYQQSPLRGAGQTGLSRDTLPPANQNSSSHTAKKVWYEDSALHFTWDDVLKNAVANTTENTLSITNDLPAGKTVAFSYPQVLGVTWNVTPLCNTHAVRGAYNLGPQYDPKWAPPLAYSTNITAFLGKNENVSASERIIFRLVRK